MGRRAATSSSRLVAPRSSSDPGSIRHPPAAWLSSVVVGGVWSPCGRGVVGLGGKRQNRCEVSLLVRKGDGHRERRKLGHGAYSYGRSWLRLNSWRRRGGGRRRFMTARQQDVVADFADQLGVVVRRGTRCRRGPARRRCPQGYAMAAYSQSSRWLCTRWRRWFRRRLASSWLG